MSSKYPESLLDLDVHGRFDQRETVFGRVAWDEQAPFYRQGIYDSVEGKLGQKKGYSQFELARALGGWAVYDYFPQAFNPQSPDWSNNMMGKPTLELESGDPPKLTAEIKKSALAYGAHSVGITKVSSRWVYSHDREGERLREPLKYDYVIVMTVAVPSEPIGSSPAFPAARASAVSYSKMAFIIACMAEFIRRLGYRAWPMGNDTALSIPLAVAAGLGKLGRNGLLLTPNRGPSVKICKVFTDMELMEDEPTNPPLRESCRNCFRCSEACEADAISTSTEPSKEVVSPSNNQGIERWAVDHDQCYQFWLENGSDCSSCIAACPHTPPID